MRLRVKVRAQSGERDQEFTTTFDGVRYTVGPEPVEVPEFAGKYLIGSFSDIMEIVLDPVAPKPKAVKATRKKAKKK